jgi:uncharacterized protein (TIGR00290 family)
LETTYNGGKDRGRRFLRDKRVAVAWSGGKDCCMALYYLKKNFEICGFITTVTDDYGRISMHGVRVELLEKQALSLGVPVYKVPISKDSTEKEYRMKMENCLLKLRDAGVAKIAHGDIFLQDVKECRERMLKALNMQALFSIWGTDTKKLVTDFIKLGFRAVTVCVDPRFPSDSFCGRILDEKFLNNLPPNIDPCGENGEFHTFVYDGPLFSYPIKWVKGELVERNSLYFCDLTPS